MYEKVIPYKDYRDKARNEAIHLNLNTNEFFKLFPEFHRVLGWRDTLMAEEDVRELAPEEVRDFYNDLETILLEAWGVPSEDGRHFRKAGRYDFQESKLFEATMVMFLTDVQEANKMLEALMPKGMEEMVKKFEGNLDAMASAEETPEDVRAQIAALQAKLPNDGVLPGRE